MSLSPTSGWRISWIVWWLFSPTCNTLYVSIKITAAGLKEKVKFLYLNKFLFPRVSPAVFFLCGLVYCFVNWYFLNCFVELIFSCFSACYANNFVFLLKISFFKELIWNLFVITDANYCVDNFMIIRPMMACLPAWFRFAQCLRRYRDTKEAFPHLANAAKYATSFFVVIFSNLMRTAQGKNHFKLKNNEIDWLGNWWF